MVNKVEYISLLLLLYRLNTLRHSLFNTLYNTKNRCT